MTSEEEVSKFVQELQADFGAEIARARAQVVETRVAAHREIAARDQEIQDLKAQLEDSTPDDSQD